MYFDYANNARLILSYVGTLGVDPDAVLRAAGVQRRFVDEPALLIPWPELERLLVAAEQLTKDPYLGLHAGSTVTVAHFGGLAGHYIVSQPTNRDAIRVGWLEMGMVSTNVARAELIPHPAKNEVTLFGIRTPLKSRPMVRHILDMYLMFSFAGLRLMYNMDWHPLEVQLDGEPGVPLAEYEVQLGCPVRTGGEGSHMSLLSAILDISRTDSDPLLLAVLRPHFENHLLALKANRAVTLWIRNWLFSTLGTGRNPSLRDAAKIIGQSVRTLQANLSKEGTTFRAILDNLRQEMALISLSTTALTVDEIAETMGYSEASAFDHAFRRWTGVSPSIWREDRLRESARRNVSSEPSSPAPAPME